MNKLTYITFACALLLSFIISLNFIDSGEKKSEIKEEEKTSGALEALNFLTRARAYPNDDIPPDG